MEKGVPEKKQKSCKNCWHAFKEEQVSPIKKKIIEQYTCIFDSEKKFQLKNFKPCPKWVGTTKRMCIIAGIVVGITVAIALLWRI